MSEDVFLYAQINAWENLDLLAGSTNLFVDNTYIGQSYIDPENIKDTLEISFGLEPDVIVKREVIKEYHKLNFSKQKSKQTIGWKIGVKNNKGRKVELVVQDQIPLSKDEKIKVKLLESTGAKYQALYGYMEWQIQLNPSESVDKFLIYEVKHPKKAIIQ